ncbi:M61 family metallopeptidase [Paraferrimonas sp. SM1919]|uniref:M61 family metallopeptidase n=1 Tax=Paraferrimonas sp. SM1919 TaxID=2662263 RepID=UPI0013D7EA9B|nr:M61 family metallopeptidase [Paraferrimonas sp. SM1919]
MSFLGAIVLLPSLSTAEVVYKIDLTNGEQHLAKVTAEFPEVAGSVDFHIPNWRTGKYTLLPTADGIRLLNATDNAGNDIKLARTARGSWQANLTQPTKVTLTYQLHADELGVRLRHLDETHAFIDASGAFMYTPEHKNDAVKVELKVPSNWQSFSGMANAGSQHSFKAANYDVLIDSPIETGINESYQWQQDGRDYEIVFWGDGNYDVDKTISDIKKLLPTSKAIWQGYPYQRYVFMIHATHDARGATEHLNSTIIQRLGHTFRKREDYVQFMATVSHEFIHTWNVKAYRPEPIANYDYQNEQITDLLWLSEGSTSYFEMPLLLRAGVISFDEFAKDLSKRINQHMQTPGRHQQSISEGSENTWIGRFGHYGTNHSVNIYSEGYLASLLLDFQLLSDSNLKASYRDVHGMLYKDYALPKHFNADDIQNILAKLTGRSYKHWWRQNIESPFALKPQQLLAKAGLKYAYPKGAEKLANLDITLAKGSTKLDKVMRGGIAWNAGFVNKDELVAINGRQLTAANFNDRLQDFAPGDKVEISFFRRGLLETKTLVLGERFSKPMQITAMNEPTQAQMDFFEAWLGVKHPALK